MLYEVITRYPDSSRPVGVDAEAVVVLGSHCESFQDSSEHCGLVACVLVRYSPPATLERNNFV